MDSHAISIRLSLPAASTAYLSRLAQRLRFPSVASLVRAAAFDYAARQDRPGAANGQLATLTVRRGRTVNRAIFLARNQRGRCAICLRFAQTQPLVSDHDHHTGRVRGRLCAHCNTMLGFARDDATVLRTAAAYLDAAQKKGGQTRNARAEPRPRVARRSRRP